MTSDRNEPCCKNRQCFYDNKTDSDWYVESYDNSCKAPIKVIKREIEKPEIEKHHKKDEDVCCCKDALRKALRVILSQSVRPFINTSTFNLVGDNFETGAGSLSGITSCGSDSITHTAVVGDVTTTIRTTFCDLILIAFNLAAAADIDDFIAAVLKSVPTLDPTTLCCKEEKGCCCNLSKAILLADTTGTVTVGFNTNAIGAIPSDNIRENLTVITVTKDIVWLINEVTRVVYVACLNGIYSIVYS